MNSLRFSFLVGFGTLVLPVSLQQSIAFTLLELAGRPTHRRGLRDLQERALGVQPGSSDEFSSPTLPARPFGPSCDSSRPADFARPSLPVK
jgi:hypothetical protein